ncbi:MAG: polyprenyl synthetase family protein [Anaerolineaceae bacterium]|nr:MAG: polyprenyl synthetase family protein [Anaerolineaceae bacterium]
MSFDLEQNIRLNEINEILESYLPKEEGYYKSVLSAMNYSITAGGKRIRPMLMLETFRLFNGCHIEILHPFMAAIEMIHTYSLVHDDLPALDNDEYRRGRKTTHIEYGEALAILAGDGLLTLAFETAAGAYDKVDETSKDALNLYRRIMRAYKVLSRKAGIHGMIGGQVIDIEFVGKAVTKERLDRMYLLKTGALIEASMMIGAILAGAKDNELDIIENLAGDLGLAFQIRDDILDVISSDKILGKPVRSDEKNDKPTYVSLMDLEQAKKEVAHVTDRAKKAYESLAYRNEYLIELIIKLINREK